MKNSSLVTKLVATLAIVVAVSYILISAALSIWFQGHLRAQVTERAEITSGYIAEYVTDYLDKDIDDIVLDENIRRVSEGEDWDFLLIDASDYIYYVSDASYDSLIYSKFRLPDKGRLIAGSELEINGEVNPVTKETSLVFIKPVFNQDAYVGSLVTYIADDAVREPLSSVLVIIWGLAALAFFMTLLGIYYFVQKMLFKPLTDLNTIAAKISKGEVSQRVNVTSDDEIGQLAKSFNIMAESLEQTDKNRRDFLSNISHELRSPITSMKGFIAGILDGIIPKDKENYYLTIVYDETQRLTRLVNDLLDLSAMESGRFSFRMTEVDLNEIIRLCIIRAETKINDKGLKVNVTLEGDHLYVAGDRDRLIQVVTNLLDNSMKHAPDNGHVEIYTKTKGKKVHTTVYNDGQSISDSDIKYIWDRFYKADKSRTNKVSTGLGLPIVRNIITQFGEDIWVENRPKGVAFTFTLSKT
ncbi:sensor histidine kinase [Youngiibacter multivorans]|uniref:histidine kinase n=1 Tax=Youngiibacter multivorans TaxID=937251 RepID=A0ABS4G2C1_9CLOT|nr:HAMP domain-containing sensor histidine kinase [Youngiibacter multivorans]MBP1918693.1 signal transduction histidine kinase [Youngiibacter multivorans]